VSDEHGDLRGARADSEFGPQRSVHAKAIAVDRLPQNNVTHELMARLIFAAGVGQAAVLVASVLVPFQFRWREELQSLSRLNRQMH
jgi:hypothetical protein